MKSIKVRYFAQFKELAGVESEMLTTEVQTYSELYETLKNKYHFQLPAEMVQVAVNDEFSLGSHSIHEGDQVVFIPPVAGG